MSTMRIDVYKRQQDTCFFLRRENRVIFVQLTGEDSLSESALKELLSLFDADFSFLDA